jgi:diguanylate cyclase (GGDEF)-like protein
MNRLHLLPDHYAAGFLASMATIIAMLVVVFFTRQLRRLEGDIQDLSLRDELTGLYNLRGFQLLAGQTMRTAQRSGIPFSVLFVDVDNLKKVNDAFGHGEGSRLLVNAAEFLKANFRENDVIGRIGGDEFAVAGHFGSAVIAMVESRLEQSVWNETPQNGRPRLSLSMGHVTSGPSETLPDLLQRADAAMYEQKRSKKLHAV